MAKLVEYLDYNDEKIPVRVSYRALKALSQDEDLDAEALAGGQFNFETMEKLLYESIKSGCKVEGTEMKYKPEDMEDILDENFMEFTTVIAKFFPSADDEDGSTPGKLSAQLNRSQRRAIQKTKH